MQAFRSTLFTLAFATCLSCPVFADDIVATWTGAGGDGLYSNPANWDPAGVPANDASDPGNPVTYAVVIPAGTSNDVLFDLDDAISVTDFEMGDDCRFEFLPGTSLTVLDDARIGGRVYSEGGTFVAVGPGAQFIPDDPRFVISGSSDFVFGGVTMDSSGVLRFSNCGTSVFDILRASGTDTVLDLSAMQSLDAFGSDNSNSCVVSIQRVQADSGGVLLLDGLETVRGIVRSEDRLEFVFLPDGTLELPALQTVTEGYVRFDVQRVSGLVLPSFVSANTTTFATIDGAPLDLPLLESVSNTNFDLGADSTLSVPLLSQHLAGRYALPPGAIVNADALLEINDVNFVLEDNASFFAPLATTLTNSEVSLTPLRDVDTAPLANIDHTRIEVSAGREWGAAFGDLVATSYDSRNLLRGSCGTSNFDIFVARSGALLDLSTITSIDAFASDNSNSCVITRHRVRAVDTGAVNLSNLTTVRGLQRAEDALVFEVGAGSSLDLSSLTLIEDGYVTFEIGLASYELPQLADIRETTFNVPANGSLTLPALTDAVSTNFNIAPSGSVVTSLADYSGGTLTLESDAAFTATALSALDNLTVNFGEGATINTPNLDSFQGSLIEITPTRDWTATALFEIDGSRIWVRDGAQFTAIADVEMDNRSLFPGSCGTFRYPLLEATGFGSFIDASSLEIIDSSFRDNSNSCVRTYHQINAYDNAMIDLSGVQTIIAPDRGEDRIEFNADSGGFIDLSSLQTVSGADDENGDEVARFNIGGLATIKVGDLTVSNILEVYMTDFFSLLDVGGNLILDDGSVMSVAFGAIVRVAGNFSFFEDDEAALDMQSAILHLDGDGPQIMEVGGRDYGDRPDDDTLNFGFGQLVVGSDNNATVVQLVDVIDNGNRYANDPEALYLFGLGGPDGLRIRGGSTLVISNINVYTKVDDQWVHLNTLFGDGETQIAFDEGFVSLVDESLVGRGDISRDGCIDASDLNILLSDWGNTGFGIRSDLNYDGAVGSPDLNIMLANFNVGCGN